MQFLWRDEMKRACRAMRLQNRHCSNRSSRRWRIMACRCEKQIAIISISLPTACCLEPAMEAAAMKAFGADGAQPVFTYLANYILADNGQRENSVFDDCGCRFFRHEPPLGPLLNRQGQPIGPLGDDEIVLNSWAADDLAAQGATVKPGDKIEITYFRPESTHGQVAGIELHVSAERHHAACRTGRRSELHARGERRYRRSVDCRLESAVSVRFVARAQHAAE